MNSYTSIFHVGLLDDLHNYFPDILYNSERFRNVQDLLQYIRHQARTRCNPFEQGLREYNNLPQNRVISPPPVQIPVVDIQTSNIPSIPANTSNVTPARIRTRIPAAPLRRTAGYTFAYPEYGNEDIIGINTIASLFNLALNPTTMVDVPVVPTNQQIDLATAILPSPTTLREPCAICQDTLEGTVPLRRINRCQHTFHQQCIDTWFQTGVTCPICRTDIRD